MKRRTFIKASVLFAGAPIPSLILPDSALAVVRAIDLKPFCDRWNTSYARGGKFKLGQPFYQEGHIYATDGCICVRVPSMSPVNGSDDVMPDVSGMGLWEGSSEWQPWPRRRWITAKAAKTGWNGLTRCPYCQGTHRVGDDVTECPHDICEDCDYTGYHGGRKCNYCKDGQTTRPAVQRIGDLRINGHYDLKIRTLAKTCGQVDWTIAEGLIRCVRFRCPGAEGLLAPMIGYSS